MRAIRTRMKIRHTPGILRPWDAEERDRAAIERAAVERLRVAFPESRSPTVLRTETTSTPNVYAVYLRWWME